MSLPVATLLLTALTMTLFAANSVLCRLALLEAGMDPVSYTALRLVSGAAMLWLILALRGAHPLRAGNWRAALALFAYMACFSRAYVELPTAVGTLIIAVAVQTTMVGAGIRMGERPRSGQALGIGIALAGLVFLLLPGLTAPPLISSLIIFVSGAAWAVYSLCGRGSGDPAAATAGNFLRCVPLVAVMLLCFHSRLTVSGAGVAYALTAGALASALGYIVWYMVVPRFTVTTAAVVQLSVPVITAAGGVVFVGEDITLRLVVSSAAILGGIFFAVASAHRRRAPAPLAKSSR